MEELVLPLRRVKDQQRADLDGLWVLATMTLPLPPLLFVIAEVVKELSMHSCRLLCQSIDRAD